MTSFIRLIRVHQWLKNAFIFAPLFFSGQLFEADKFFLCFNAFIVFSLGASAVYVLNDLKDIDEDREHPVKKSRPLASGAISARAASVGMMALFIASLGGAFLLGLPFLFVMLSYFVINLAYSFGLKTFSLIDILIIAAGFVLRIIAGGVVTGIEISHWLFIMTFLVALFIAFAKRRDDVIIEMETGEQMRKAAAGYNLEFISTSISILCGVLIVSYIIYITSAEIAARFSNRYAYASVVFVIVGILRYLQVTIVEKASGAPTKLLLRDRFLQAVIGLWVLFFALLIYFKK